MKLNKKFLTVCAATAVALSMSASCFAEELLIKNIGGKAGKVKINAPVITGAQGGPKVDRHVNILLAEYALVPAYSIIPTAQAEEGRQVFIDENGEITNAKKYNAYMKVLAKQVNNDFNEMKAATGTVADLFLDTEYAVKAHSDTFISVYQESKYNTGGAHDNVYVDTFNYDLKTGRAMSLENMFAAGADYKTRLNMLIDIQNKGTERIIDIMHDRAGSDAKAYAKKPSNITGKEKFYVTDKADIVIVYAPGEIAPISEGIQTYTIAVDTIADIIHI